MKYMQLGLTDLIVSRICFGCWQLSPRFWGEVPIEPWRRAVTRAAELGVNFIDTAGAYGDGFAETCLGDCLAELGLRDRFYLATKFYWNFQGADRYPETTYEFIMSECENSLRRLKTDRIDLYQIHAWDPLTRPEEVAAALGRLKKEGKIRWAGVSNMNVEQMGAYRDLFDVASLQPHYNLLAREVEDRELPYCLQHRIGVIPYSPLYRGLLTGKYARDHVFKDSRGEYDLYTGGAFPRMLEALDETAKIAEGLGLSMAQLAIRWVLTNPAVTSAIVGIKTPEHIESIVPAAEGTLPIPVWHRAGNILGKAKRDALALLDQE